MKTQRITNYMIRQGIIREKQSMLFSYALEDTFHQAIIVGAIMLIGIALGHCAATTTFLVAFPSLRRYCGGIHAVSRKNCFLSTLCLYLSALWMTVSIDKRILSIGAIFSAVLIFRYAPVEHKNNILNLRQKRLFRWYSQCIVVVLTGTAVLFVACMDSHILSMPLCTIVINGANVVLQKDVSTVRSPVNKYLLNGIAAFVLCIGMSSLQSACRNWNFQPECPSELQKYMDRS